MWTTLSTTIQTQSSKKFLPPPLRLAVPFQTVREHMLRTLEEKELQLSREDRNRGLLLTQFREYISGPLTGSHIAKIGDRPKMRDGEWVSVQYQYEILMELIRKEETVVTVNINIRASKMDYFGSQGWVDIATNGQLEQELLTAFGKSLFGQTFTLEGPKRRYWERTPSYVPDIKANGPTVVGPGRRN